MPAEPPATAVLAPAAHVAAQRVCGQLVLVPLDPPEGTSSGECQALNATGEAVWALVDGTRDLATVASTLAERYEEDPVLIAREVLDLTGRLQEAGFLVPVPQETQP